MPRVGTIVRFWKSDMDIILGIYSEYDVGNTILSMQLIQDEIGLLAC